MSFIFICYYHHFILSFVLSNINYYHCPLLYYCLYWSQSFVLWLLIIIGIDIVLYFGFCIVIIVIAIILILGLFGSLYYHCSISSLSLSIFVLWSDLYRSILYCTIIVIISSFGFDLTIIRLENEYNMKNRSSILFWFVHSYCYYHWIHWFLADMNDRSIAGKVLIIFFIVLLLDECNIVHTCIIIDIDHIWFIVRFVLVLLLFYLCCIHYFYKAPNENGCPCFVLNLLFLLELLFIAISIVIVLFICIMVLYCYDSSIVHSIFHNGIVIDYYLCIIIIIINIVLLLRFCIMIVICIVINNVLRLFGFFELYRNIVIHCIYYWYWWVVLSLSFHPSHSSTHQDIHSSIV